MIELRPTTDTDQLTAWRREVITAVFGVEPDAAMIRANREYYRKHIADGSHVAFVASLDGNEAGCGAICLADELPSPDNATGRCAYLMNVYVRRPWRGHGVARAIVGRLVAEAKSRGCGKIYLESTGAARPLYRSAGFITMQNMMRYDY